MDTRTGDILTEQERLKRLQANPELIEYFKPMSIPPSLRQLSRKPVSHGASGRVGRNDPCPCGSGLKFKKCCYVGRKSVQSSIINQKS